MSAGRWKVAANGFLIGLAAVLGLTACFEVDERSARKLRIFYSGDIVGNVEPCG